MNTQKLKASWLKTMAAAFAAALMAAGAHGAEKITVDKVANHYPWDGKVDCVTTLSGLATSGYEYKGAFTLSVNKGGEDVSKTVTNDFASTDGTYTNTFDCAALFGAGFYPTGSIVVDLVKNGLGVQLWADGPYWAECNVGASKPEEYGYYFWWGDTVGYQNRDNAWKSVKDGTTISFYSDSSPANSTYNLSISTLSSKGYIDSTGNLAAAHDAATVHLGDPWRMPTDAEIQALVSNCTTAWITTNGVSGRLVTGKGEYASKSIFLPAAGYGLRSDLNSGSYGSYWSSTPHSGSSYTYAAWGLYFSSNFLRNYGSRYAGQPVRPVRTK